MVEFRIQLEESVVQTVGHAQVETYLQAVATKLAVKAAGQEVLEDLNNIDLENDEAWQTARHLAWQQEKHKYVAPK